MNTLDDDESGRSSERQKGLSLRWRVFQFKSLNWSRSMCYEGSDISRATVYELGLRDEPI
jgi:hypothetical protein